MSRYNAVVGPMGNQAPTNPLQLPELSVRCHGAGQIRRAAGSDTGWGRFADVLIACIEGGEFRVELEDGSRLRVPAGSGFMLQAGVARRVQLPRTSSGTTVYAHMECRLSHGLDAFVGLRGARLLPPSLAQELSAINRAYATLSQDGGLMFVAADALALGARMMKAIFTAFPDLAQPVHDGRYTPLLPVLRHIEDHLHETLSREDLAGLMDCSVSHLHVLFKEIMGLAPMEFLRESRLRRARRLLLAGDASVADIAERCGFPDAFYFSRVFAREEGMPPSRYRRSMALPRT